MPPPDIDRLRREAETPRPARRDELRAVASDLALAFGDDPHFDWFMRADAERPRALDRFFRVILKDACFPDGVIARPDGGGAAAVWLPSEAFAKWPWTRDVRALPMLLHATGLARWGRLTKMRQAMDAHHDLEVAHDYLWFLGVRPDLQGFGLGSRLLGARTRELDALGRPAYLITGAERNVALYRRHGFEVAHDFRPAPDGPIVYGMWREPRADG